MKRRSLLGLLALVLLLQILILGSFWATMNIMANQNAHPRAKTSQDTHPRATIPPSTPTRTMDAANAFARAGHTRQDATATTTTQTYDSRPCAQQPSPEHCNGVLPLIPHTPLNSREHGSGSCFDQQITIMEDQQISNSAGHTIADFQLWFFIGCKSYAAHLIAAPDQPPPTIQLQVQQYDAATAATTENKNLHPSATQASGPLVDQETWSPLLYSPHDPVQASMSLRINQQTYMALTHFYAAGQPTSIHGHSQ
ncbi:hypothetical protein KSD_00850 [Ktedonobacter sp. SOSP1-85]|uniref:hypothetical protein n=1 Tax=Ktedonobacter sp. SOSP1-85 TaxID=2778367 RepID=UPI00191505E4|nr:hypothetical protein [Ktedonobacter sp. SOSP1-85]GHO72314.1 hypothetical protein KSD_00850 [Ktedonobacter sp. SOSP1-85]